MSEAEEKVAQIIEITEYHMPGRYRCQITQLPGKVGVDFLYKEREALRYLRDRIVAEDMESALEFMRWMIGERSKAEGVTLDGVEEVRMWQKGVM